MKGYKIINKEDKCPNCKQYTLDGCFEDFLESKIIKNQFMCSHCGIVIKWKVKK